MEMQELKKCKKILIEVNQTCNLNCTYCFYKDYGRTSQSLTINNIIELLKKCPTANEFYLTGGECFTSINIENIIEKLSQKGKVIVFTNGIILNKYSDNRLLTVVNNVDRFIISFDSFDFKNYFCRKKLDETINTIEKILKINPKKVEVKVCITQYNYEYLEKTFEQLIKLGVEFLSVNFVFDIQNSTIKHEVKETAILKNIFRIIYKYKKYFNIDYINMLYDLYINNKINDKFPCLADYSYYYLTSTNQYLICPGNCKKIGQRGNWKECFSKECANEWEIMYMR